MSKHEYDLSGELCNLDGVPYTEPDGTAAKLSKSLSEVLAKTNKGDAIEMLDWALELRKTGKLTLSDTEREKLYEIIKSEETMTNIFKAQILKSLKKVENADVDH